MNLNCIIDPNIAHKIGVDDNVNSLLSCMDVKFRAFSGGEKYRKEIFLAGKGLTGLLMELQRTRRLVFIKLDDDTVDQRSRSIVSKAGAGLDDEHIMGIIDVGQESILFGHKKICVLTYDGRSHKFLTDAGLYTHRSYMPKVFPVSSAKKIHDILRVDLSDCLS